MYNFQASDSRQDVARERAAYEKLLAKYNALNFAGDEGVFKITVHSESGAIDVPVSFGDGRGIVAGLMELHAKWVRQVEIYLNDSLISLGQDTESEANRIALKEEAREQQLAANLAEIARINKVTSTALASERRPSLADMQQEAQRVHLQELAQEAAATPAQQPAPKRAGRPKKAVAATLGRAAVAVPMNGAGQQPTGQASQLPH